MSRTATTQIALPFLRSQRLYRSFYTQQDLINNTWYSLCTNQQRLFSLLVLYFCWGKKSRQMSNERTIREIRENCKLHEQRLHADGSGPPTQVDVKFLWARSNEGLVVYQEHTPNFYDLLRKHLNWMTSTRPSKYLPDGIETDFEQLLDSYAQCFADDNRAGWNKQHKVPDWISEVCSERYDEETHPLEIFQSCGGILDEEESKELSQILWGTTTTQTKIVWVEKNGKRSCCSYAPIDVFQVLCAILLPYGVLRRQWKSEELDRIVHPPPPPTSALKNCRQKRHQTEIPRGNSGHGNDDVIISTRLVYSICCFLKKTSEVSGWPLCEKCKGLLPRGLSDGSAVDVFRIYTDVRSLLLSPEKLLARWVDTAENTRTTRPQMPRSCSLCFFVVSFLWQLSGTYPEKRAPLTLCDSADRVLAIVDFQSLFSEEEQFRTSRDQREKRKLFRNCVLRRWHDRRTHQLGRHVQTRETRNLFLSPVDNGGILLSEPHQTDPRTGKVLVSFRNVAFPLTTLASLVYTISEAKKVLATQTASGACCDLLSQDNESSVRVSLTGKNIDLELSQEMRDALLSLISPLLLQHSARSQTLLNRRNPSLPPLIRRGLLFPSFLHLFYCGGVDEVRFAMLWLARSVFRAERQSLIRSHPNKLFAHSVAGGVFYGDVSPTETPPEGVFFPQDFFGMFPSGELCHLYRLLDAIFARFGGSLVNHFLQSFQTVSALTPNDYHERSIQRRASSTTRFPVVDFQMMHSEEAVNNLTEQELEKTLQQTVDERTMRANKNNQATRSLEWGMTLSHTPTFLTGFFAFCFPCIKSGKASQGQTQKMETGNYYGVAEPPLLHVLDDEDCVKKLLATPKWDWVVLQLFFLLQFMTCEQRVRPRLESLNKDTAFDNWIRAIEHTSESYCLEEQKDLAQGKGYRSTGMCAFGEFARFYTHPTHLRFPANFAVWATRGGFISACERALLGRMELLSGPVGYLFAKINAQTAATGEASAADWTTPLRMPPHYLLFQLCAALEDHPRDAQNIFQSVFYLPGRRSASAVHRGLQKKKKKTKTKDAANAQKQRHETTTTRQLSESAEQTIKHMRENFIERVTRPWDRHDEQDRRKLEDRARLADSLLYIDCHAGFEAAPSDTQDIERHFSSLLALQRLGYTSSSRGVLDAYVYLLAKECAQPLGAAPDPVPIDQDACFLSLENALECELAALRVFLEDWSYLFDCSVSTKTQALFSAEEYTVTASERNHDIEILTRVTTLIQLYCFSYTLEACQQELAATVNNKKNKNAGDETEEEEEDDDVDTDNSFSEYDGDDRQIHKVGAQLSSLRELRKAIQSLAIEELLDELPPMFSADSDEDSAPIQVLQRIYEISEFISAVAEGDLDVRPGRELFTEDATSLFLSVASRMCHAPSVLEEYLDRCSQNCTDFAGSQSIAMEYVDFLASTGAQNSGSHIFQRASLTREMKLRKQTAARRSLCGTNKTTEQRLYFLKRLEDLIGGSLAFSGRSAARTPPSSSSSSSFWDTCFDASASFLSRDFPRLSGREPPYMLTTPNTEQQTEPDEDNDESTPDPSSSRKRTAPPPPSSSSSPSSVAASSTRYSSSKRAERSRAFSEMNRFTDLWGKSWTEYLRREYSTTSRQPIAVCRACLKEDYTDLAGVNHDDDHEAPSPANTPGHLSRISRTTGGGVTPATLMCRHTAAVEPLAYFACTVELTGYTDKCCVESQIEETMPMFEDGYCGDRGFIGHFTQEAMMRFYPPFLRPALCGTRSVYDMPVMWTETRDGRSSLVTLGRCFPLLAPPLFRSVLLRPDLSENGPVQELLGVYRRNDIPYETTCTTELQAPDAMTAMDPALLSVLAERLLPIFDNSPMPGLDVFSGVATESHWPSLSSPPGTRDSARNSLRLYLRLYLRMAASDYCQIRACSSDDANDTNQCESTRTETEVQARLRDPKMRNRIWDMMFSVERTTPK